MNCILKIARSSKSGKLYGMFDLNFTRILMDVDDVVKLTGMSYSELQDVKVENPIIYEVDIQEVSK